MSSPKPAQSVEFAFDRRKAVAVIGYLAERVSNLNRFRLAKLVFLADEYHLVRNGRPIIGGHYYALPAGPVPSEVLNAVRCLAGYEASASIHEFTEELAGIVCVDDTPEHPVLLRTKNALDLGPLSDSDIAALDHVVKLYGEARFQELFDVTHAKQSYIRAWAARGAGSRAAPMRYEDFFEGNPDARPGAREVALGEQEDEAF